MHFQVLFPHRLFQNIEYSPLCYAVGPRWLCVLYTVVGVYWASLVALTVMNLKLLTSPFSPPLWVTTDLFSMSVNLFLFCK